MILAAAIVYYIASYSDATHGAPYVFSGPHATKTECKRWKPENGVCIALPKRIIVKEKQQ